MRSKSEFFFFFQAEDGIRDVAVTGVQTCALPILDEPMYLKTQATRISIFMSVFDVHVNRYPATGTVELVRYNPGRLDRKSTRLNSSHGYISYAVFCLKKKKHTLPHYILSLAMQLYA